MTIEVCKIKGGIKIKRKEIIQLGGWLPFFVSLAITQKITESIAYGLIGLIAVFFVVLFMDGQRKERLKKSGISDVDVMDGIQFEHYLVELFKSHGYSVKKTSDSNDFGADLYLKKDNKKIVVQAKRYKGNVGIKAVQEIIGAKSYYDADEAWVITNSQYTKSAKELAIKSGVRLLDRSDLIKLQIKTNNVHPSEIKSITNSEGKIQCERCGSNMVLRKGKRGDFYGCSNFPKCRSTKKV